MNVKIVNQLTECGADTQGALERFVGNADIYCKCIRSFFENESLQEIENSIKEGSYDKAINVAHALKGVSGNLGLTHLHSRLGYLLQLLRDEEYTEACTEYKAIQGIYSEMRNKVIGATTL